MINSSVLLPNGKKIRVSNGSIGSDGVIRPSVGNNTGNFIGTTDSLVSPQNPLFGSLSVDNFTGSDFNNGNFTYVDPSFATVTDSNLSGKIVDGRVKQSQFIKGVTTANSELNSTSLTGDILQGKIDNASVPSGSIKDGVTTSTGSQLNGTI